jgi:hypothetical protein
MYQLIDVVLVGWWQAASHRRQGGIGWVPEMHLEKYDPDPDPLVYRDTNLPKPTGPLHIYSPFARSNSHTDFEAIKNFVRQFCNYLRWNLKMMVVNTIQ